MTRRLFVPPEKWIEARAVIQGEPHRHLSRVLRARPGDKVTLFDGHGGEADAEILTIERDQTTLSLGARRQVAAPAGPRVVLLQSLARGEKMDFIIQKTTELGVHEIVPDRRRPLGRAPARGARPPRAARAGRRSRRKPLASVAAPTCRRSHRRVRLRKRIARRRRRNQPDGTCASRSGKARAASRCVRRWPDTHLRP